MRREEGNAVGFEAVWMVLLEVSMSSQYNAAASISLTFGFMHTFVLRAADFASQVGLAAGVGFQKVAAIRAKDERSNGGHVCDRCMITCKFCL